MGENEGAKEEWMNRAEYLDDRKTLIQGEWNAAYTYDKAVVALSGGALGLSIAFLNVIAGQSPTDEHLLIWSWSLLGLSLFCALLSFLTSQADMRVQQMILGDRYEKKSCAKSRIKIFPKITIALTVVSLVSMVSGVITLMRFALSNLSG